MPISISGTTGVSLVTDASITPVKLTQPKVGMATISTLSGTSLDVITTIPNWATTVKVFLNGVSLSGTSMPVIRLGTAGGIATTGYISNNAQLIDTSTGNVATVSDGFYLRTSNALTAFWGCLTLDLSNASTNTWVATGVFSQNPVGIVSITAGGVNLSGALTTIRILSLNGTDTFDAGSIGVRYE